MKSAAPMVEQPAVATESLRTKIDWGEIVRAPAFRPGVAVALGFLATFWGGLSALPGLWTHDEYYSHGIMIPFIVGYVIYRWWPKLCQIETKPSTWAAIPLALLLAIAGFSTRNHVSTPIYIALVGSLIFAVAFVAGWRWARALAIPALYVSFALPVWQIFIDQYTNPLQVISAKSAFQILKLIGFDPFSDQATLIHLNHYTLDVGIPCSGLKLVLALTAFSIFFMMIANLRWWSNAILAVAILPLTVMFNGLRIAMIGIVGEIYGDAAGHAFHDYSGYITLGLCFFTLFKFVRLLGWKD